MTIVYPQWLHSHWPRPVWKTVYMTDNNITVCSALYYHHSIEGHAASVFNYNSITLNPTMEEYSFVSHTVVGQMESWSSEPSLYVCMPFEGWLGEGFSLLLEEEACGLCGQVSALGDGVTSRLLSVGLERTSQSTEFSVMIQSSSKEWRSITQSILKCLRLFVHFKIHWQYTLYAAVIACYLTFTCKARKHWYLFNMSGLFWRSCTVVTTHNFLLPFGWCGFKLILTSSTVPRHCHATFPSPLMRNQDTAALCQEGYRSFPQLPSLLI